MNISFSCPSPLFKWNYLLATFGVVGALSLQTTVLAGAPPIVDGNQGISRPASKVDEIAGTPVYQEVTVPHTQRVSARTPVLQAVAVPEKQHVSARTPVLQAVAVPDKQHVSAGTPVSQNVAVPDKQHVSAGTLVYQDVAAPDKQHVFAEPMLKNEIQVLRFPKSPSNNGEQPGASTTGSKEEALNATIQHLQEISVVRVSLSDIATRILEKNLSLKGNSLDVKIAKADQLKAFAEFLPSLRFSTLNNYFHGGLQIISNDLRRTSIKTQSLQAELYYPVNLGGKQLSDYRGTQATTEATVQDLKNAQATKLMKGLKAYFDLQLAYAGQQIALHASQELDGQLKKVQGLYDAGVQPKIGILDTQFLVYRRTVDLQKADQKIRAAQIALAELTNYPPDTQLVPKEDFSDIEALGPIRQEQQPIEAYIARAVQQYPSLLSAKATRDVAVQALKSAKADLFPTMELSAYTRLLGNFQNYLPAQNAGLSIQWNILDNMGVKGKANLEKQRTILQQAETKVDETQLNVMANLQSAYADMESCHQQMDTHFENLKLVLELYEHSFNRFYEGVGPYSDVNNALVDLNTLRGEYAKASVEYYTNRLMLNLYAGDLSSLIEPEIKDDQKLKAAQ